MIQKYFVPQVHCVDGAAAPFLLTQRALEAPWVLLTPHNSAASLFLVPVLLGRLAEQPGLACLTLFFFLLSVSEIHRQMSRQIKKKKKRLTVPQTMTKLVLEARNNNVAFKIKIFIAKNKFNAKKKQKSSIWRQNLCLQILTARKRMFVLSQITTHQPLPSLLQCHAMATPTYAAATKQPRTAFFATSPAQYFTWPGIALSLRKTVASSHLFPRPRLRFAYWFLKFTSKVYPLLLFPTSVNNVSMNTTKGSSQYLLSEFCRLWWCLINWLWDKKVHIVYSGFLIWAYTSLYRCYPNRLRPLLNDTLCSPPS